MKILLDNTTEFVSPSINTMDVESVKRVISDQEYFRYISQESNGGFYFKRSLHLYGFCSEPAFHSILKVNEFFKKEYGAIAHGKFVFGQDIFANQFAFTANGIFSINSETGESDFLARDFADWLELLSEDIDYLTGINLLQTWESIQSKLQYDQRLCAKKPFVIGGEFSVDNLYAQSYPTYLASNANIALQIYGKPDGTKIILGTSN